MIYLWLLAHILLGALAVWFLPSWALIGFAFWLKEMGELKYKVPGSITTREKNLEMIRLTFADRRIYFQWFLPMVVAYLIVEFDIFKLLSL